jgi:sec-independent protein translocase protein TatA
MGGLSIGHWVIVAIVVLVLFGRGRISDVMGDFGKGIKSFKEGMADETNRPVTPPPSQIPPVAAPPAETAAQPVQPENQWPKV